MRTNATAMSKGSHETKPLEDFAEANHGVTKLNRRRFLGVVSSASVVGIAGCSGESDTDDPAGDSEPEETDTSEPEDTETQTEESSSVCTGDTFDCTEEFAQTVLSELEESGNTPEPIDAGVFQTAEGESVPENAMLFGAFDLTNQDTLGRQIGNMVFGPIYENWPDYPNTEEFHFQVYPTTDAEDVRTTMHVKKWWIEGLRDGDLTTGDVSANTLDTSTEPLDEVVN